MTVSQAPAQALAGGGNQSALMRLSLLVALGGAMPLLILLSDRQLRVSYALIVCALTLGLAAWNLAALLGGDEPRIAKTAFWLFVYVSFGVAAMSQHAFRLYPALMDLDTLAPAALAILLGSLAFAFAYKFSGAHDLLANNGRTDERVISRQRALLLALLSIPLSLNYVRTVGGVGTFFSSRGEIGGAFETAGFRSGSQVGSALLLTSGTIPVFIAFTVISALVYRQREMRTVGWAGILSVLFILNVIVNNPITNARYWILTVVMGYLFCVFPARVWLYRTVFTGGVAAAILAFPYSDYFRTPAEQRELVTGAVFRTLATKDYDQMIMTANGIWWQEENGFQMGRQLLGAVFFAAPRALWKDKPLDTGVAVGIDLGVSNVNLSSPLWVEGWVDFGLIGTLAFLGVLGILARRLDQSFIRSKLRDGLPLSLGELLTPIIAGYMFIILRGPLLQSMSRLAVLVALCYIVSIPATRRHVSGSTDAMKELKLGPRSAQGGR